MSTNGNDLHEYQRDEHRVHLLNFHYVWTPKRRKAVLVDKIAEECRTLIEQKCLDKGWKVLELAVQPDHIHLFVRIFPDDCPADVVKECKGIPSYHLRRNHPSLLKLPSLWTRSYFVATAGNVSSQTIQRYIEAHKGK